MFAHRTRAAVRFGLSLVLSSALVAGPLLDAAAQQKQLDAPPLKLPEPKRPQAVEPTDRGPRVVGPSPADKLKRDLGNCQTELAELKKQLAVLEKKAARPTCSDHFSVHVSTGRVDCAPYHCEVSSGLCRQRCTNSTHCARGFVCDASKAQCVRA